MVRWFSGTPLFLPDSVMSACIEGGKEKRQTVSRELSVNALLNFFLLRGLMTVTRQIKLQKASSWVLNTDEAQSCAVPKSLS